MDSEADADSGKGRFEVKFKLGKFAGWEGSLAPARVECHSRRAGAARLPDPEILALNDSTISLLEEQCAEYYF